MLKKLLTSQQKNTGFKMEDRKYAIKNLYSPPKLKTKNLYQINDIGLNF